MLALALTCLVPNLVHAVPTDLNLTNYRSEPSEDDAQVIQSMLEEQYGTPLSPSTAEGLKQAVEYFGGSEPAARATLAAFSSEDSQEAGKGFHVLYCGGLKAALYGGGGFFVCVSRQKQIYNVTATMAGATGIFTADLGVLLVKVKDGEIDGSYKGVGAGGAAGLVGGQAGAYLKHRYREDPTPRNYILRVGYSAGFGIDASIGGLFIQRESRSRF